jgi:hypothetical protein
MRKTTLRTKVAGVTFNGRQGFIAYVAKNMQNSFVTLRRDPNNAYDKNAIQVIAVVKNGKNVQLGFVPKELAKALAPAMDQGLRPWVKNFRIYRGGPKGTYGVTIDFTI